MKIRTILIAAVILFITQSHEAGAYSVVWIAQPCRSKQILGGCVAIDPVDGRERLVLLSNNEIHGCEMISIDFTGGIGDLFTLPSGSGSWDIRQVSGNLLVMGTFYNGHFIVFDLGKKQTIQDIDIPGESYIWNLSAGPDGRIYGGTYPGAVLCALDLDTFTLETIPAPVEPNLYLFSVTATPWGTIVANSGYENMMTISYDPRTGTWKKIPGLESGRYFSNVTAWDRYVIAFDPRTDRVEAFEDASWTALEEYPFELPGRGSFKIQKDLTTKDALYFTRGNALLRFSSTDEDSGTELFASINLKGDRYIGSLRDGRIVGVRGQSYFIVDEGTHKLRLTDIPVKTHARPPLFIKADRQGKIWGGPWFGQTLFHYDVRTHEVVNTDVMSDEMGEIYDIAFADNVVYAVSYPDGELIRYDPTQPWDQLGGKNPRSIFKMDAYGYIRPSRILVGPDGRLYSGYSGRYGKFGGAIAITDPVTSRTEIIENPLGTRGIQSLAVDEDRNFIGTHTEASGLTGKRNISKFGVLAIRTQETLFESSFETGAVKNLCRDRKTNTVVFTVNGVLCEYDTESESIIRDPVPGLEPITAGTVIPLDDGSLITGTGTEIVRIDLVSKA